jgi:hypothetical protein
LIKKSAMKGVMREVLESFSGEWWQHMASKGISERMDRFSEVAEAAAVRGGNSPVGSSGVQQRKVKQRKQRKHSWAVRKQKEKTEQREGRTREGGGASTRCSTERETGGDDNRIKRQYT